MTMKKTDKKKSRRRPPTLRQIRAMKIYVEGGGRVPLGEAMRRAGYSYSSSIAPYILRESYGWKELVKQYFPDETILRVQERGLNAKTFKHIYKTIETRSPDGLAQIGVKHDTIEVDDMPTQLNALDMVYKIRDKYPKKDDGVTINNFSLANMAELEDKLDEDNTTKK